MMGRMIPNSKPLLHRSLYSLLSKELLRSKRKKKIRRNQRKRSQWVDWKNLTIDNNHRVLIISVTNSKN
jgi:hypothetical protein